MSNLTTRRSVFLLLAIAFLPVVIGAAYARIAAPASDENGGGPMASEYRTTRVIEVTGQEQERQADPSSVFTALHAGKLTPERETIPLEELKARMGILVIPAYLPEGFTLEESYVERDRLARLVYKRGRQKITITHDTYPPRLQVKEGFSRAVTIGSREGYVVDGSWLVAPNGHREWAQGLTRTLLLDWDEVFLRIHASPAASVVIGPSITVHLPYAEVEIDEAELIKIAESLQPY